MESVTPQPVCAKEAIDLLNCVSVNPFDRDKCLRLLDVLRNCVLEKMRHVIESDCGKSVLHLLFLTDSRLPETISFPFQKVKRFSVAESSHSAKVPKEKERSVMWPRIQNVVANFRRSFFCR